MSRLDEYIKRYQGLHTGKDPYYQTRPDGTGATLVPGDSYKKEMFSGIQFLRKFPKHVKRIAEEKGRALTILDYGCGQGNMPWRPYESYKNGLWGYLPDKIQSIYLYDPSYPPFATKPPQGWQFDIIGCADVMEHVPEEDVDAVLLDMASFCKPDGVILFSISGNKAFKTFEDGENLHCTIRSMEWWTQRIKKCKRACVLIHSDSSRTPAVDTLICKIR